MQDFLSSTRHTVSFYKQAHDEDRLIIKPPFQRNPVWTDAQKSFLIDSILQGFPIPELYIQEVVDEEGKEIHTIVDGQQRIRACLEFIEGKFSLTEKDAPNWAEQKFDDLLPAEKKKIFGYNFIVRQLPNASDEQLRIIFKRLNRNVVALNRQELRHATYWGAFITRMEALADLDYWTSSGVYSPNDIRRMLDIEFISELSVAYLHGLPNKKATLDKWYETYENNFPDESKIASCFNTVLGELSKILPDIAQTRWRRKSDFYSLFLFLAKCDDALPLTRSRRMMAASKLKEFGKRVDDYLSSGETTSGRVRKYGNAVQKAASDLGSRERREQALAKLLAAVIP